MLFFGKTFKVETGADRRKLVDENSEFRYFNPEANPMQPEISNEVLEKDLILKEEFISHSDGNNFYVQTWTKKNIKPKAIIFYVHGYGSTVLFLNEFISKNLCYAGYTVIAMDGYGHGLSDGDFTRLDSIPKYCDYFVDNYFKIAEKYKEEKKFLFTISIGGSISYQILKKEKETQKKIFDGVVNVSPCYQVAGTIIPAQVIIQLLRFLYYICPQKRVLPKDIMAKGNNKYFTKIILENPILCSDPPRVATGLEFLRFGDTFDFETVKTLNTPMLTLHGEKDLVVSLKAVNLFHKNLASKDKSIKLYKNGNHNLMLEEYGKKAFKDVIEWIDLRI